MKAFLNSIALGGLGKIMHKVIFIAIKIEWTFFPL